MQKALLSLLLCLFVLPAHAANLRPAIDAPGALQLAAADCYASGQKVAAQQGGELSRATPAVQDGKNVCVVVVLIPAEKSGDRPRRKEIIVPQ